jgi:hypothetical protein
MGSLLCASASCPTLPSKTLTFGRRFFGSSGDRHGLSRLRTRFIRRRMSLAQPPRRVCNQNRRCACIKARKIVEKAYEKPSRTTRAVIFFGVKQRYKNWHASCFCHCTDTPETARHFGKTAKMPSRRFRHGVATNEGYDNVDEKQAGPGWRAFGNVRLSLRSSRDLSGSRQ